MIAAARLLPANRHLLQPGELHAQLFNAATKGQLVELESLLKAPDIKINALSPDGYEIVYGRKSEFFFPMWSSRDYRSRYLQKEGRAIKLELEETRKGSTDPLSGQRIPRKHRRHAREYFDRFREGE